MKNKLLRLLAAASIFVATAANAVPSVTTAQVLAIGDATVAYANDPTITSTWNTVTSSPTMLSEVVSLANSTFASTAACSAMGTYSSPDSNNVQTCTAALTSSLVSAGVTSAPAVFASGLAVSVALGSPLPGSTSTTPTTPTTSSVAEVVAEAVIPQIQRATSIQQATIISNVVSNIFSTRASARPGAQIRMSLGEEKGMAAGDSPAKLNAWFNASDSSIGNSATTSSFSGNVSNALGGVDYMFSPQLVAGVSIGYDRVSLNYNFLANSGLASEGWMVAPYASYKINDIVSVDGAYGYASGNADTKSSGVTTTQGYTRNFFALNLNGDYWMGNWQLTGKANYINAEEKDSLTSNRMEQLRLGGQAGYWMDGVMPYASITYVNDLKVSSSIAITPTDKEAWVAAIGLNLFSKGAVYGGVSYTHEFERQDSKNDTLMASIGYRF